MRHRTLARPRLAVLLLILISGSAYAEVCVYEHEDYRGGRKCFKNDVPNLDVLGINDSISSLRVHGDVEVILYNRAGYKGHSQRFDHDARWLEKEFNDSVSSIRIVPREHYSGWGRSESSGWDRSQRHSRNSRWGDSNRACLYSDWNFQGREYCFDQNTANFSSLGFDNQADSIRIEGDVEAILYQHENYQGYSRSFRKSMPKFEGRDHDQYSSIRLRHR